MTDRNDTPELSAILAETPARVFKSDKRSRVWLVEHGGAPWVVKQFRHNLFRQRVAALLGVHPGQREARQARRLAADTGLPVVPVSGMVMHPDGFCVVTRFVGESLQHAVAQGVLRDPKRRHAIVEQIARHLLALHRAGWFLRDYQAANLVLDNEGACRLIDVGSARRASGATFLDRMAALLVHTLRQEGASRADVGRVLRVVARAVDGDTPAGRGRVRRVAKLAAERAAG